MFDLCWQRVSYLVPTIRYGPVLSVRDPKKETRRILHCIILVFVAQSQHLHDALFLQRHKVFFGHFREQIILFWTANAVLLASNGN